MINKYERRSRLELILEMLNVISDEGTRAKKTRIMKKSYMDWWSFEKYFAKLIEHGFVEKIDDPTAGMIYALTGKGKDLQERLEDVKEILEIDPEKKAKTEITKIVAAL